MSQAAIKEKLQMATLKCWSTTLTLVRAIDTVHRVVQSVQFLGYKTNQLAEAVAPAPHGWKR